MDNDERELNRTHSHKVLQESNENRIEQLIDLVEKHTRTERHLEQNLGQSSIDNIRHALKVQEEREKEIENLKNIIVYGKHENVSELHSLNRNYTFTNNYLSHNAARMDPETLERAQEKQEHRKGQLNVLENRIRDY